jgi:hypothetical protein
MPDLHRVLPLLNSQCAAIDELFIEEVGPFGRVVVAEVRQKWLATGRRVHTSDIDDYITLLAGEVPEPRQRAEFIEGARMIASRV